MSGHAIAMEAAPSVLSLTCHTCSNLAVGWGEVAEVDFIASHVQKRQEPSHQQLKGNRVLIQ